MAMSRSFGATLFTTRPPIAISPRADVLQPGDHPQQRRFAAAGRADQDDELAIVDLDADAVQHLGRAERLRTSRMETVATVAPSATSAPVIASDRHCDLTRFLSESL